MPKLEIDRNCLFALDSRIASVMAGRMSLQAFSLLITPDDPFVLIDGTIYLMTPEEYYASRISLPSSDLIDMVFTRIMEQPGGMDGFDEASTARLKEIAGLLPTCPACRLKRYRYEVYTIAVRNKKAEPIGLPELKHTKYPDLTGKPAKTVSRLLAHMFKLPAQERKSCIDCVEKHVAQAYILAAECATGYPEHISNVVGHLSEAIDELPVHATALRDTLVFCLAKTAEERRPFMPLAAIMAGVNLIRMSSPQEDDNSRQEAAAALELDYTDEMMAELTSLEAYDRELLLERLEKGEAAITREEYEGALALASEMLAQKAPAAANMLRNRRLMFRFEPNLAKEAGYSLEPLMKSLSSQSL